MIKISVTQLRARMSKYFNSVESGGEEVVVTRRHHEPLVILSLKELGGLRETLHVLSSSANAERLFSSIAALNQGEGTEQSLIEE